MALPRLDDKPDFSGIEIESGCKKHPQFTILYGKGDSGKTTAACYSDSPVIIPVGGEICHQRFPTPKMENKGIVDPINHVFTCIKYLLQKEHNRKTVIIDNLTSFREAVEEDVVRTYPAASGKPATSFGDYDFGRGQAYAFAYYKRLLAGVDALMKKRDMHVILIAHDGNYNITRADGTYYTKCSINAPGGENTNTRTLLESRAHNVFFMRCEDRTRAITGPMGVKKTIATSGGISRVIYTKATSEFFAKTKIDLPSAIEIEETETENELIKELSNTTLKNLFDEIYK